MWNPKLKSEPVGLSGQPACILVCNDMRQLKSQDNIKQDTSPFQDHSAHLLAGLTLYAIGSLREILKTNAQHMHVKELPWTLS